MKYAFVLGFFTIVVAIPVIFGVLGEMFKRWTKLKQRELELMAERTAETSAQYAAKTERLEQRVAVLERLLTDRSTHLADEIESLRDKPLN